MRGYLKTLGWVFKLQPKTTVGRHEDSDLCLQNGGVEERHALIELSEAERCFVLRDLNSTHGTFVNECRIHNAAVRLSPGDELHFGFGGPTYQLAVDSSSPLSCPPVNQRLAWQSPLQLIEGSSSAPSSSSPLSQLPVLPGHPSTHSSWVQGGPAATPHPPSRARPASAGTKRSGSGHSTDHGVLSHRTGSCNGKRNSGTVHSLGNAVTAQSSQTLSHLLQEKEERLLRLGDEVSRLSVFEGESRRKDGVIAGLRDEVSALRHQLTQNRADPEVRNKLRDLERDIGDKKEQIEQLKAQMLQLQRGSSEVFSHSLTERDLKISSLRNQVEKLKNDNNMSSGLVTSLQRDLSSREKQSQKLAAEVDRLRQDIRHKDAQLGSLSVKFSRVRENQSHQEELRAQDNEAASLRKRVEKLEQTLTERRTELQRLASDRDSLKSKLEAEQQRWASVQAEADSGRQQLQDSRQREQRSRVELERVQARLERLRSKIIQTAYSAPEVSTPQDAVSDQQVIEQVTEMAEEKEGLETRVQELEEQQKEISEEREELRARVQELEERFAGHTEEQDRIVEEAQGFRSALEECQSRLQEALSVPALQREISALQDQFVPPSLAWVQSAVLSVLAAQLSQVQEVGHALRDAGIEDSDTAEGAPAGIRALWHESQEREAELRALQVELQEVRGGRDVLIQSQEEQSRQLQDQLSTLREELEQLRQLAQNAQSEEDEGLKLQLEEMRKELESVRGMETSLREEARAKEAELHSMVEEAKQKGAELERECYRVREAEYREQVRQHAHTIVDMDQRLTRAIQRVRDTEEERDSLREQLTDLEKKLENRDPDPSPVPSPDPTPTPPTPGKAPGAVALEETVTLLRAALAEARQEAVAQGDVIAALSRDLAAANARMSDVTGELSEQRKVELEQHRALVVDQRVKLSTLTEKLAQMSQLVDRKGEELQSVREELRQCQEELERRVQTEKELKEKMDSSTALVPTPALTKDVAAMAAAAELAEQGSKCRGHRHEEVIQRQQEALAELRSRAKALEQAVPMMSSPELCIQQVALMRRELSELRAQKAALYRGAADSMTLNSLPGSLSEEMLERTARLDVSEALELSERTYLELARVLSEALELSDGQLSGTASLKHLPRDERERLGSLRQRDLELLRTRLSLLHSQAQRREELLQEYHRDMGTLRDSQATGQQLQARLDSLRAELQTECQESSLLREALQRAQARLEQEIGLNRALKERKGLSVERLEKRITRTPSHSCVQEDVRDKAASRKANLQEKLKKREYEIEVLKKQLRNSASGRPASAQRASLVPEAH
ncbi:forkhead-associated domain-containing protein 1 [Anguilla anguilla]|uniref:forkhead-associated domain-containing protein 1 n=1 Tax=Anguilla anguilla TaxID=7936 RepID=UPI0015B150B6|nr:forkhead-associated domain-containing protein 1 [Anguilla anguilla]